MSVTETLDLDIADALRGVDKIGDALKSAVTGFRADLGHVLTSAPPLVIDIDAANLRSTIGHALSSGVTIPFDVDEAEITRSLNRSIANANTSGITIDIDGAAITRAINAAISRANTGVNIGANATGVTSAINGAVAAANTNINVTGTASIDGLDEASGGMTVLGGGIKGVVAGLAALGGIDTIGRLANATSDLEEATNKVRVVFQGAADDVFSFASTSSTALGITEAATLEAAGTFGNFFTSAGLARQEAADLSVGVVQLASDLASFNNLDPTVTLDKLRAGLAGEIEPLRSIGINLTEAAVQAKAVELGLAELGGEVDQAAKLQARYALILEQSSNAQGDFARTSDSLANQQRILRAQFEDILTVVGAPLVSPLLSLLQTGVPILGQAADAFGELAAAVLPALDALLTGAAPAATEFFKGIGDISEDLAPALLDVGTAFGDILGAAAPVVSLLAELVSAGANVITVLTGLGDGAGALGIILGAGAIALGVFLASSIAAAGGIGGLTSALLGLQLVILANPVGLLIVALSAAALALGALTQEADKFAGVIANIERSTDSLTSSFFDESETLAGLTADLAEFDKGSRDYIDTASAFARAGGDVQTALSLVGLSAKEIAGLLADGDDGLKDFTATAIKAGQVKIEIDGVEQTARQVRDLDADLSELLTTGEAQVTVGEDLVAAFDNEQVALRGLEFQTFKNLIVEDQVTQAQADAAVARAKAAGAADVYGEALRILAGQEAEVAKTEEEQAAALRENANTWLELTAAIAAGKVTTADYQKIADDLGLTLEQVQGFADGVTSKLDAFADAAIGKLPTVQDAISGLGDAADPQKLIDNLKAQAQAISSFTFVVNALLAEGNDDLAQFLLDLGPVAAAPWIEAIRSGGPEIKASLEANLDLYKGSVADAEAFIRTDATPRLAGPSGAIAEMGKEGTKNLGLNLDFFGVFNDNLALLQDPSVVTATGIIGSALGLALADGFGLGVTEGFGHVTGTLTDELGRVVTVAKGALRIESPSKVFFGIGEQVAAGLALGISTGGAGVVAEAEAIARSAIGAAGGIGGRTTMPVGAVNNTTSSVDFGGVHVTVTPPAGMTQSEAATLGQTIGAAAEQHIRTQMRLQVGHA